LPGHASDDKADWLWRVFRALPGGQRQSDPSHPAGAVASCRGRRRARPFRVPPRPPFGPVLLSVGFVAVSLPPYSSCPAPSLAPRPISARALDCFIWRGVSTQRWIQPFAVARRRRRTPTIGTRALPTGEGARLGRAPRRARRVTVTRRKRRQRYTCLILQSARSSFAPAKVAHMFCP